MKRTWKSTSVVTWVIIILAGLGLITDVVINNFIVLKSLLLPVIVFVVVFLLFRFYQPGRMNKHPKVKPSRKTMEKTAGIRKSASSSSTKKNKNYPFQVIEGQKGKKDDQMPKYH